MRFRKTPTRERQVYRLLDEEGHVLCEFNPETDTTMDVTIIEKRKIVKAMHAIDDHEVYVNNKERRLHPSEEAYLPKGSHRAYVYLDAMTRDEDGTENEIGDSSRYMEQLSVNPFADDTAPVQRLKELAEGFTKRQYQIYKLVLIEGYSKTEAAEMIGITPQRAKQITDDVLKKIEMDGKLRKLFRADL